MFQPAALADLPAFRCGHAHNAEAGTGCTVIVAPEGAACGVAVRGGGPATRETDLLKPENMIEAVHAVVLSGGSAFGLAASTGVMDELAARGIGFPVGGARVPIVVGACLFDLLVGEMAHPDAAMGREACAAAFSREAGEPVAEGNVGAGCGATVGKLLGGERAMKAGLGVCGLRLGGLAAVAIVAVNALGCVRDAEGTWIAGCRDDEGGVMDPLSAFAALAAAQAGAGAAEAAAGAAGPCANTTIGVVLTNARLTKAQATKASSVVHDAFARAIKPVHTSNDGDTVFTFASGEVEADYDLVAVLATEAMQGALVRAVEQAEGAYGLPAARDLAGGR
ncbi:P1 family peptidase [Arabiibacter massiliensis]|uniref:P1 family peptidase n=1 Tax=Arabiibacter massiliensis TaxID=1870985 RepID=UPI0009BB1589|nr:P1 family peptidase [Arabiibacter massiliensis]